MQRLAHNVGAPVTATDPDGDPLAYFITGSSAFTIDANSDQITVAAGAGLDYETTPSYTVTVQAEDDKNGISYIEVTITITDVPEPPFHTRCAHRGGLHHHASERPGRDLDGPQQWRRTHHRLRRAV